MSEQKIYDPEDFGKSFYQEINNNHIIVLEKEIQELKNIIADALIVVMHEYSEAMFCSGWQYNLDVVAPREDSLISNMAKSIGKIPCWIEGSGLSWRDYPSERDKNGN